MRTRLMLDVTLLSLLALFCTAEAQKRTGDPPSPRSSVEGASIFHQHCAACHGSDGRGQGTDSTSLRHPVPDLTLISHRNGGKFPYQRVKKVIEGTQTSLFTDRNREMPIWGPVFHEIEVDQDWGEVRLDAVTRQVEAIQRKE
jgi:mono/diheme cytochrome c family protein